MSRERSSDDDNDGGGKEEEEEEKEEEEEEKAKAVFSLQGTGSSLACPHLAGFTKCQQN